MDCTMLLSTHIYAYVLDNAELELEELMEQAHSEDPANLALDQGKLQCIWPIVLVFYFESLIYVLFWLCIKSIGTLWHHSCIKIDLLIYPC
jgi:hypothetical protein